MTKYEVLNQLNQNQLQPRDAYKMIYKEEKEKMPKKAHFVKIKIRVPESRGATIFLAALFALPIHIGFVRMLLSRRLNKQISDDFQFTFNEIIELVSVKGVIVDVHTKSNERILIKTI